MFECHSPSTRVAYNPGKRGRTGRVWQLRGSQLFLHTWYQCCHTSLLPPDKPHVFPHTWWEWSASRSAVCLVCAMSLFLCIRRKNREMKDMQKELDDWATITCEYTQLLSDVCVSHVASLHPHTVSSFTQRSVQQGVDSWHSWAL